LGRGARWAVLAIALGVRAWAASPPVLHDWDERYHALVAKHLLSHPLEPVLIEGAGERPAGQWTSAGVFLHKPPLALWLMAAGRWVFGPSEWAFRVASVLLGVATTALTLWLGTEMLGAGEGLLAGFVVALQPELMFLAAGTRPTDHVDAQLVFWVTASAAAFWALQRKPSFGHATLVALALAGGLLTKSWPALAVVPAALLIAVPHWRRITAAASSVLGGLALAAPWSLYARQRWPATFASESAYAWQHLTHVLEGHSGGPFFFLVAFFRWAGPAGIIAVGYGLWLARTREEARFLGAWLGVPLLLFSLAATKMHGYLAPELPALALLGAWVARDAWRWAEWRRGGLALGARALAASVPLWAIGATALALPRALAVPDGYAEFRERALVLTAGDRVFNLRWAPQAMVYSDAWATSSWPLGVANANDWIAKCPQTPPPPVGFRGLELAGGACER
jgi:4-amino-4-deoxy-L-arabinose transferase